MAPEQPDTKGGIHPDDIIILEMDGDDSRVHPATSYRSNSELTVDPKSFFTESLWAVMSHDVGHGSGP